MFDFNSISEFSRTNCLAICAFLVPANLLLAIQTMVLTVIDRPASQVRGSVSLSSMAALLMVLHVSTWFAVGVVQAETFILLSLGVTCLGISTWAIVYPQTMSRLGKWLLSWLRQTIERKHSAGGHQLSAFESKR